MRPCIALSGRARTEWRSHRTQADGVGGVLVVGLRGAIAALPDDRDTAHAVRETVAFFASHEGEPLNAMRVGRATGLEPERLAGVLAALVDARVVDCDGDPAFGSLLFRPDAVLAMEVRRFLRTSPVDARLQRGADRFRGARGTNRY